MKVGSTRSRWPNLFGGSRLNVPDCTVEMHRQLFYHRDKWMTPQMKAFIELVRQPAPSTASK